MTKLLVYLQNNTNKKTMREELQKALAWQRSLTKEQYREELAKALQWCKANRNLPPESVIQQQMARHHTTRNVEIASIVMGLWAREQVKGEK